MPFSKLWSDVLSTTLPWACARRSAKTMNGIVAKIEIASAANEAQEKDKDLGMPFRASFGCLLILLPVIVSSDVM